MVMAFVIVTPPNPPGSSTLISPPAAVLEMAPAKVLHGAVRLQGLASSPTPDTHVRVACAFADPADAKIINTMPRTLAQTVQKRIFALLHFLTRHASPAPRAPAAIMSCPRDI